MGPGSCCVWFEVENDKEGLACQNFKFSISPFISKEEIASIKLRYGI